MTPAQKSLYWRLWGQVCRAKNDFDNLPGRCLPDPLGPACPFDAACCWDETDCQGTGTCTGAIACGCSALCYNCGACPDDQIGTCQ